MGTLNNLQMLNTQNLPTLLYIYNIHKISIKYSLTQNNISQYCRQELCLTASGFLRQKKDLLKTKGGAVPSV